MRKQIAAIALVAAGLISSAALAADSYKIDPAHTSVVFKVKHMDIGYVYGRFDDVAGEFTLNGDSSTFALQVESKSVDTNNKQRDEHLRGDTFFDVKQFPKIEFKATQVKIDGDDYKLTGDLTLHGVTKHIEVALKKTGGGPEMDKKEHIAFEGQFMLKRSEYGMDKLIPAAGDDITLMLTIDGAKE